MTVLIKAQKNQIVKLCEEKKTGINCFFWKRKDCKVEIGEKQKVTVDQKMRDFAPSYPSTSFMPQPLSSHLEKEMNRAHKTIEQQRQDISALTENLQDLLNTAVTTGFTIGGTE